MTRYIAFLRAINVSGHVVKMDALRRLFEDMGFTRVETFIASGNVIFESETADAVALERRIAEGLRTALGYEVVTFLRTPAELASTAAYLPFAAEDLLAEGVSLYVGFLGNAPAEPALQTILAFRTPVDEFAVYGREIYWLCRIRSSDSMFSLSRLERAIGMQATFRNVTTVRKMAEKYAQG
ncbi:MAG TPA: DUF1697 domain-containing protein [Anaerolineaceae bacterium]|jgi:uncharacterized protein (DUF1697 family)